VEWEKEEERVKEEKHQYTSTIWKVAIYMPT
jgi:hypothetical protein